MKNVLAFYYNLKPKNIHQYEKIIKFVIDDERYCFYPFNRPLEDAKAIYELDIKLLEREQLVHEIILNKDKQVLTFVNEVPYVLFRIYINEKRSINLSDLCYLSKNSVDLKPNKLLLRTEWVRLWEEKLDYFEYQMSQMGKKYPIVSESFSYFLGMGENAISYIHSTLREFETTMDPLVVSHKRIDCKETQFEFYNPIHFVIDYECRDISEYIKSSFFNGQEIFDELDQYFSHQFLSVRSLRLLYGRLMYPSYYFDLYELVLDGRIDETNLLCVIEKISEYEEFLHDFYDYVQTKLHVVLPDVEWVMKK